MTKKNNEVKTPQARRKYSKSEKGKATQKRYNQSEKGKAAQKRYGQSEKGRAKRNNYRQSEKRKVARKRYEQSEKGKAAHKCYKQSEKGKASRKRYEQSEKGKIANRKRANKYAKTLHGRITIRNRRKRTGKIPEYKLIMERARKMKESNHHFNLDKNIERRRTRLTSRLWRDVDELVENEAKVRSPGFFRREKTRELIVKFLMLEISPQQVCDLTNEDMPFSHGEPHINGRNPSNGETRQFFIPPALETKIKAYYDEFRQGTKEKDPFLATIYGKKLWPSSMSDTLHRIGEKLGIDYLTPGIFRRTLLHQREVENHKKQEKIPWALPLRRYIETNVDIPKDAEGKPDKDEVDYQIQLIKNAHKRRILKPELPEPIDGWLGARYKYNFPVPKMRRRWPRWRGIKGLADLRPLLPWKKVENKQS